MHTHIHALGSSVTEHWRQPITTKSNVGLSVFPKDTGIDQGSTTPRCTTAAQYINVMYHIDVFF